MANGKRFEVTISETAMVGDTRIVKDKVTGVLYIYHGSNRGGGLTPLLDAGGKPVVEPVRK